MYFSRSLAVNLVPNNAVIRDYVNGFAAANAVTDPDTSIYIRAGSFEVQSNLNVSFIDQIDNHNRLIYTVYSVLASSYFIETTLARAQQNDFGVTTQQRAFTGTRININDVGSSPVDVDLIADTPFASPFAAASSYITTQPLFLRAGRQYQFDFGMDCIVQIYGAARFFQGSSASCDASRSGYWNGLASATDETGNPMALPDLIGEDGFNYRFASPLSPDSLPAVPEPSTWALLIAGLGLVGAVVSRRRAPAL